ncbi:MAG: RNA-binding protein [Candidatus Tectomicrobia bacterium]|nr:RNA-binding protein [Candidatus Tectomicrobia bacterium]
MANTVYVGNLSYQTTKEALSELFQKAGVVQSVRIITDAYTGKSRGFAFVEMSSNEEVIKAIEMFHGYLLDKRTLIVNEARSQRNTRGESQERGRGHRRENDDHRERRR